MSETGHAPTLVFIVGPPAVGKMAVGHELAQRTGFKLFHNHHTIDLAIRFFPFGSPPFQRLVAEFRRRILEEVAASELPGLISYVWAFARCRRPVATSSIRNATSIWAPTVKYIESMPNDYSLDEAVELVRPARMAAYDAMVEAMTEVAKILTPEQIADFPPALRSSFDMQPSRPDVPEGS